MLCQLCFLVTSPSFAQSLSATVLATNTGEEVSIAVEKKEWCMRKERDLGYVIAISSVIFIVEYIHNLYYVLIDCARSDECTAAVGTAR